MARKSMKKSKKMRGGNADTATATASNVVPAEQHSTLSSSDYNAGATATNANAATTPASATTAALDTKVGGSKGDSAPVGPVPVPSGPVTAGSALAPSKFGGKKTLKAGKKSRASKRTRGNCDSKAYCVKCKKMNTITNCVNAVSSNGRNMVKGTCAKCGTKMNKFV